MASEIVGKLIEKFPIAQISDTFKKREFVIEQVEQANGKTFSNFIKFQLSQDKTSLIDSFALQQDIKVFFNIKGVKWRNKNGVDNYFVNLEVWRITPNGDVSQQDTNSNDTTFNDTNKNAEVVDDLPF